MTKMEASFRVRELSALVCAELRGRFAEIDAVSESNTARVLDAFREERVSDACFAGTTGYGYDDMGRDTLDRVYARVFGAESALVRLGFVNGTHAIASMLFGCLAAGDALLYATGAPYDTLQGVISGPSRASLRALGVSYRQAELRDGSIDGEAIAAACADGAVKLVVFQRSRGYSGRRALSPDEIGAAARDIKARYPDIIVAVDNCYGEFTALNEPCALGADIMAGSLIKNPGGGLAPAGGYVAGRRELVEAVAERLTVPGIGGECGATLGNNRLLFQGFFLAPHTVAQALKTAAFASALLGKLGYTVSPGPMDARYDIVQTLELGSPETLVKFCRGIQGASPIDSFASPEPCRMPGYDCDVVMAAGAFIQGSSIELSCDGPLREPYTAYMQGGVTFEAGKLGVMAAAAAMLV